MATKKKGSKFDWNEIGSAPATSRRPAAPQGRLTVLVSAAAGVAAAENPNVLLLQALLPFKGAFKGAGVRFRAKAYTVAFQRDAKVIQQFKGLGVNSLPAVVATFGGDRRVAVGHSAGLELVRLVAESLPAAAPANVDDYYDAELRSSAAWTAAREDRDESEEIGGVAGDIGAEYQEAMRGRGGSSTDLAPSADESGVIAKAEESPSSPDDSTGLHAADGADISDALAMVSEGSRDDMLSASFWENNTETAV